MEKNNADEEIVFEKGSDNIFADLGFPNAEEHLLKANIVIEIKKMIEAKGLTQTQAAKLVGEEQPDMSNILRGQFRRFSVERLLRIVNRLGHRVEVRIYNRPSKPGAARTLVVTK